MIDTSKEDKIITVQHARRCFGGCVPGWQAFCKENGISWREAAVHGVPASRLLSIDNAMAHKLVRWVYEQ